MSPAAGVSVVAAASLPEFWAPFRDWLGLRHGVSDALQLFALGFARWAPVTSLTPFLGGRLVPATVRIGLAFVLAGHIPQPGEVLEHPSGWRLEVTDGDTRRVTRLRLHAPEESIDAE